MMTFLNKIKPSVARRAEAIGHFTDLKPNTLDFCEVFKPSATPAVIAEIKFASPSRGRIYPGSLDAVAIAGAYLASGAAALSILTEPTYFQGSIEYLRAVRDAFPNVPILLKDFVLSQAQITQSLAYGANAVLLIVAFLTEGCLRDLYNYAIALGLTPLIEVHDVDELNRALALNPKMIGINHRNLKTLEIDLDSSRSLIELIPSHIYRIAESGIDSRLQLDQMVARGFNGCLIGSHFMQNAHPGYALERMLLEHDDAR